MNLHSSILMFYLHCYSLEADAASKTQTHFCKASSASIRFSKTSEQAPGGLEESKSAVCQIPLIACVLIIDNFVDRMEVVDSSVYNPDHSYKLLKI